VTAFRTRRLRLGDESNLNAIYNRIVGRERIKWSRSLEAMRWIWHQAPGGPVDSWVIETEVDTEWTIIGHHALCPVRFTFGDEDLLCAKTMNSFLLPEFRDRFSYLRFEQECLREVDARFDATYSVGAGSSRLRSALGYTNFGTWIQFERGFQPLHVIYRVVANLVGRQSYSARARLLRVLASISAVPVREPSRELVELTSIDAPSSRFFSDFWKEARIGAGMAPRRGVEDLEWRFWKRQGFQGTTLTYTSPVGRAYFIVETANPVIYSLADFYISPPQPELFDNLLDALYVWCAQRGALAVRCRTITQGLPAALLEVLSCKMKPSVLQRFIPAFELPRRFSVAMRLRTNGVFPVWNTTDLLVVDSL